MAYKGTQEVVGPASSTDEAIVRYDAATGFRVQNSGVLISDTDQVTGATLVDAGNLRLTGNTLSSTDTNGDINIVPDGSGNVNNISERLNFQGILSGFAGSEFTTEQSGVQTTDATVTTLGSFVVGEEEMVTLKAMVNGFRSTFDNAIGGELIITAYRDTGGNVTQVGNTIRNLNATDAVTFDADVDTGTQSVRIRVTGIAAQTWNWTATVFYQKTLTDS